MGNMLEVARAQQSLFPKSAVADLELALDQLSGNAQEVMDRMDKTLSLPLEKVRRISAAEPERREHRERRPARKRRRTPA